MQNTETTNPYRKLITILALIGLIQLILYTFTILQIIFFYIYLLLAISSAIGIFLFLNNKTKFNYEGLILITITSLLNSVIAIIKVIMVIYVSANNTTSTYSFIVYMNLSILGLFLSIILAVYLVSWEIIAIAALIMESIFSLGFVIFFIRQREDIKSYLK